MMHLLKKKRGHHDIERRGMDVMDAWMGEGKQILRDFNVEEPKLKYNSHFLI